jgi:phospholipid transport system transporter-binding protein
MSEISLDPNDPDLLRVNGELSFATVPRLLESGAALLAGRRAPVLLDLGGVTRADSAGLALLVEWLRVARGLRTDILYRNVPPQMLAIARVSGLDGVLPVADVKGGR